MEGSGRVVEGCGGEQWWRVVVEGSGRVAEGCGGGRCRRTVALEGVVVAAPPSIATAFPRV